MRCIFCKKNSDNSKSVEHIVPESLGNVSHVLPRGIVCDGCNNYFARKIEGPLLADGPLRSLRFHQTVLSKRGRVPQLPGIFIPHGDARLELPDLKSALRSSDVNGWAMRFPAEGLQALALEPHVMAQVARGTGGFFVFADALSKPNDHHVSRFLGKCAIEAFAQRLIRGGQDLEPFVDFSDLDPLRRHVREGQPRDWAYSARRIYDQDRKLETDGRSLQTVFEYDLLLTHPERMGSNGNVESEIYFVLVLFGLELAINLGGSELDGYETWLKYHNGLSPLYAGKNALG